MAITASHKSQFRQRELPAPNTNHIFLENKPLSNDALFCLLTFCSHLLAYEPVLSKESIESNHVNTLLKSSFCSHFCSYFLGHFCKKIGTSSAKTA